MAIGPKGFALALACCVPITVAAAAPAEPDAGHPRQDNVQPGRERHRIAVPFAGPTYVDLTVRIEPAAHSLHGYEVIHVEAGRRIELALGRSFHADALIIDGKAAPGPATEGQDAVWTIPAGRLGHYVEARWHGQLRPLDVTLTERQALVQEAAASDAEGTFLPAAADWYPVPRGVRHTYRVTLDLPRGQRGVVPGELLEERDGAAGYRARFSFDAPAEGIDLMAGPYRIAERKVSIEGADPAGSATRDDTRKDTAATANSSRFGADSGTGKTAGTATRPAVRAARVVRLRTYFHRSVAGLSASYLDAAQGYVERYSALIGRYPYGAFSVVSSPTPTGFGMPTLTYLGVNVLRLPFIRSTSLGHEVLHNWWGNGVYADPSGGNWAEGLTTFMADYAYREQAGPEAARAARLEWLRDFTVLPAGEDWPLSRFVSRRHESGQIIGYGKAAMVFFMLRDTIGPSAFDAGIKKLWQAFRFRTASWDDLREVFERASGQPLAGFFAQWVKRAGAPRLRIECADTAPGAPPERLRLTLTQEAPPYQLSVPLMVETDRGREQHVVAFYDTKQSFDITLAGAARAIELDPDLRLFRRFEDDEIPPIFRRVMVDPTTRVVLLSAIPAARDAGRKLAAAMSEEPSFDDQAVPGAGASLLVVGLTDEVDRWLATHHAAAMPQALRGKGDAVAWAVLLPAGGELVAVAAQDPTALGALVRPLPHYGRRGFAVFRAGKLIESGLTEMPPQRTLVNERRCGPAPGTPR